MRKCGSSVWSGSPDSLWRDGLNLHRASRRAYASRLTKSEVQFLCLGDRDQSPLQISAAVFGAHQLVDGAVIHAAPTLDRRPGRIERARIADGDGRLQHVTPVDQ